MRVHNQSQHHACHLCNRSESRITWSNQNSLNSNKTTGSLTVSQPVVFRVNNSNSAPPPPRLHHPHLPASPRSEAPRSGVEGEWRGTGGLWWDRGRRGAALPAVWGAVQDGHTAPGPHGHPRQPRGPQPWPDKCGRSGHHQRGCHCVQCEHSGTAGNWLLQYCPPAPQLACWKGRGVGGWDGRAWGWKLGSWKNGGKDKHSRRSGAAVFIPGVCACRVCANMLSLMLLKGKSTYFIL